MMKDVNFLVAFVLLALASSFATASDPGPLQDFCVAINDTNLGVFVNGKFCKNPALVTADDFLFTGLNVPRNTSNYFGSNVTLLNVDKLPGANTLGVAIARIDFAPNGGLNPPHAHPRASEIFHVLEGTLYAGFITANPKHTLFSKVLKAGDVFVFPQGLIHFQWNIGKTPAVGHASFNSQNPGVITIANALFGSNSSVDPGVLAKAFQLDIKQVEYLQHLVWESNSS